MVLEWDKEACTNAWLKEIELITEKLGLISPMVEGISYDIDGLYSVKCYPAQRKIRLRSPVHLLAPYKAHHCVPHTNRHQVRLFPTL